MFMLNYKHCALLLATAVSLMACSFNSPQPAPGPDGVPELNPNFVEPTPLPTREVAPRTTVAVDGVLALAASPIALAFEASAKVISVNAKVGQTVKQGDVLGSVDDTLLQDAVVDAQMSLDLVEAQIRQQGAPTTKEELASAQAALNSAYATYSTTKAGSTASDIEQARMSWESSKAQFQVAQSQRDFDCSHGTDTQQCKAQESSLGNSYESLQSAYERYQQLLEPVAREKLTQAYTSVASAKARLDSLKSGSSDEQKQVAQTQYDQAKAALARAKANLGKAILKAPCSCIVQEANIVVGGVPTSTAFLLVNVQGIQFKTTNLSERDIANVNPGSAATIRLKAYDETFVGKVVAVLSQSTGAQSGAALFTVLINLDATTKPAIPSKQLLPGMTGQAEIAIR